MNEKARRGNKPILSTHDVHTIQVAYAQGMPGTEIAALLNLGTSIVYRVIRGEYMAHDDFRNVSVVIDDTGKRETQKEIVCCKCGATEHIKGNAGPKRIPTEGLVKIFAGKGWSIGKNRNHDVCPTCVEARKSESTKKEPEMVDNVVHIDPNSKPFIVAEPPREMTKEDRRKINRELADVYSHEKQSYVDDWNDEKVAKVLGVPRAWVASVRDEGYGPEHSVDFNTLLLAQKNLAGELEAIKKVLQSTIDELNKEMADLTAKRNAAWEAFSQQQRICQQRIKELRDRQTEIDRRVIDSKNMEARLNALLDKATGAA